MKSSKGVAQVAKKGPESIGIIYTIGHSNKDISTFTYLLQSASIQTVIDCRTKPRSRWPQYNAARLEEQLTLYDIDYELRGHNIGGLAGNVDFNKTLQEISSRASYGERIALLCSEGKPEDCHRSTVLAPELEYLGLTVQHLLY